MRPAQRVSRFVLRPWQVNNLEREIIQLFKPSHLSV